MHRLKLINLITAYSPLDAHEAQMREQLLEFINREPNCFDNFNPEGHVTASAWILDPKALKVGLILHGRRNMWFQPGGHSDGRPDTPQEALREAVEEFGIPSLKLSSENIFDIDVHTIEEDIKRGLGAHLHFDIRFLVFGDSNIEPVVSSESHAARWVPLQEVLSMNNEPSIQRLVKKTQAL